MSENHLCYFVSTLAEEGLQHQTLKCYMSALRYAQIARGFADPFAGVSLPCLEFVLKGVKKTRAEEGEGQGKPHLPITPSILKYLRSAWSIGGMNPSFDQTMLWAACCLGFFGFLRAAEFTAPSAVEAFDPGVHLALQDIALDSRTSPSLVRVKIKCSKTDPFRRGVEIYLGHSFNELCPVAAMTKYLAVRGDRGGPYSVSGLNTSLQRSAGQTCTSSAAGDRDGPDSL